MKTKRSGDESSKEVSTHEDPFTGEHGAHPVGTGIGAALGGAITGAAAGTLGGPIGTVVGTIAGGIAGAYAGKTIAEDIDPTVEAAYWREAYVNQPYYSMDHTYEDYEPAYKSGWESFDPATPSNWMEREETAKRRWESEGGARSLKWEEARLAAEDAYSRAHQRASNKPR